MIFSGLLVLPRYELYVLIPKSFIHKSRCEVSLVEQEIIDYVSTSYLRPKKKFKLDVMQLLSADGTIIRKKNPMKT